MTPTRWVLVGAVAFILLTLRIEARDVMLALIDPLSPIALDESVRPSVVQLGVMVLALTGGLALLVRWLKSEVPAGRYRGIGPRNGLARQSSRGGGVNTPLGMYQSKKSGGPFGRRR